MHSIIQPSIYFAFWLQTCGSILVLTNVVVFYYTVHTIHTRISPLCTKRISLSPCAPGCVDATHSAVRHTCAHLKSCHLELPTPPPAPHRPPTSASVYPRSPARHTGHKAPTVFHVSQSHPQAARKMVWTGASTVDIIITVAGWALRSTSHEPSHSQQTTTGTTTAEPGPVPTTQAMREETSVGAPFALPEGLGTNKGSP